jgi:hypothetical protein
MVPRGLQDEQGTGCDHYSITTTAFTKIVSLHNEHVVDDNTGGERDAWRVCGL